MAKLSLRFYPDPILKQTSSEVMKFDKELHHFLDDLAETMYAEEGIGLAAPQVGVLSKITVIDTEQNGKVLELINPQIIDRKGKINSDEGCLSIPGYRDIIKRAEQIKVSALNRFGEPFEFDADELLSRCCQHEIDHLEGVLFIDHLSRLKKQFFQDWFKKQTKE